MLSRFKLALRSLTSPRLYRAYIHGVYATARKLQYQPNRAEVWAQAIIFWISIICSYVPSISPFVCIYYYIIGYSLYTQLIFLSQLLAVTGVIYVIAHIVRAIGRFRNPVYVDFLEALNGSTANHSRYIHSLRQYDFAFDAWPVSFTADPAKRKFPAETVTQDPFASTVNNLPAALRIPLQAIIYTCVQAFTFYYIFPGSSHGVYYVMSRHLLRGRAQFVEQFQGCRRKIVTVDDNSIDTMFINRRNNSPKGKTLVICCDGNAGYYEIGILMVPVQAGYSALGWNHPGFAWSTEQSSLTSIPYKMQEQNAIDAVIQLAIYKLGFDVTQIVLYGWSVGCYAATWAAANYPDIKCLVLDAPFDTMLALVENTIPPSMTSLVKEVIRHHINLDIGVEISKYKGPVKVVRRTKDDSVCVIPKKLVTNRGNNLVIKLIAQRHPDVSSPMHISCMLRHIGLTESERISLENTTPDDEIRKVLLKISKYMRDYVAPHSLPLKYNILVDIISPYDIIPCDMDIV